MVLFSWCFSVLVLVCSVSQVISKADEGPGGHHGMLGMALPKDKIDKCLQEVGLTKEELKNLKANESDDPPEKLLCFMKCAGTSSGAIGANGALNIAYIKDHIPPPMEKESDTILACLEKAGPVATCQDAKKVLKCFPKHSMVKN